ETIICGSHEPTTMIPAAALTVLLLQLRLSTAASHVTAGAGPLPHCQTSCGAVEVPYPFGIGDGCYWPGFNLTCDRTRGREPRLLVGADLQVVEISLTNSTVRIVDIAGQVRLTFSAGLDGNGTWGGLGAASPYVLSEMRNQFVVTGCNVQVTLVGESDDSSGGNVICCCSSFCSTNNKLTGALTSSPGYGAAGCCDTPIPIGRPSYGVEMKSLDSRNEYAHRLPIAVRIAERGWFESAYAVLLNDSPGYSPSRRPAVPVVLDFAVDSKPVMLPGMATSGCPVDARRSACQSSHASCRNVSGKYRSGYVCRCLDGYRGNPYLAGGCKDVDECALPGMCFGECINTAGGHLCRCQRGAHGDPRITNGCTKSYLGLSAGIGVGSGAAFLIMVIGAIFVTRKMKQRRGKMLKKKFFKQNRGHLLQQLVSQKADIAERMIIPLVELHKATNNFDKAREIGGGGHGTVYKGIMSDLQVVAIKKSKVAIQREIDEFINEIAILSQINHRNVVKLHGCCLETEVPLLVYEFISNGTLYHHLHVQETMSSLPWEDRLRIATEIARALTYLHSAVAFPIVHRDIKSPNILLDGTLMAKVSDFGASRFIPADQTKTSTAVQGTFGYLDPVYFYSGKLTEKSDVYSFGVLLMELLTRKKPCSYRSSEEETLVSYFTASLEAGKLIHVLDPQVMEEGGKEVEEVATLAVACTRIERDHRPTMRQVEMTLESLGAVHDSFMPKYQVVVGTTMEGTSRQYSLEAEHLLSSRYPR
uniref:Protein kinase domain-containing protein n=2 Tax=Aegilops tauschii TaxID=37682 RepID=A0A453AD88_AEGTS